MDSQELYSKKCNKCLTEKPIELFCIDKTKKDGFHTVCKKCKKQYDLKYTKLTVISRKEKQRLYYLKNKEKIILKSNQYYNENKHKISEKCKLNRHKISKKDNERYKNNIQYKMKKCLRNQLHTYKVKNRSEKINKYLGCSLKILREYLENKFYNHPITKEKMTWDNHGYGADKWNIDHIIPLCNFDLTKIEEIKKACHYSNLQPLWDVDHRIKTKKDIQTYRKNKHIITLQ